MEAADVSPTTGRLSTTPSATTVDRKGTERKTLNHRSLLATLLTVVSASTVEETATIQTTVPMIQQKKNLEKEEQHDFHR